MEVTLTSVSVWSTQGFVLLHIANLVMTGPYLQ